ncbi:glycine rich domain-containing protein [Segatella albensis]|uniref:glycine rich domain-containing protein n=1 Tax=Segatella albensis TaxID=77768 RepID=UPI00041F537C|nr:glycine rich domain-containing protein [Segatella albensis]
MQTFTAPLNTTYKIECWGAQGGDIHSNGYYDLGGKGGYSIGYKSLITSNKLYICVGSQGSSNSGNTGGNGGYNGGGRGGNGFNDYRNWPGGAGGGGATHIAITTNRGVLKNYEDYQSELILVAGAGGGMGAYGPIAGVGGGLTGGDAFSNRELYTIKGATQTSGYTFGQGQNGINKTQAVDCDAEGVGGGGGGFYGGLTCLETGRYSDCCGAGGSGYVGGVTNGATIAGDQTFPSPSGGTETGHSGNGYCIITWQQLP